MRLITGIAQKMPVGLRANVADGVVGWARMANDIPRSIGDWGTKGLNASTFHPGLSVVLSNLLTIGSHDTYGEVTARGIFKSVWVMVPLLILEAFVEWQSKVIYKINLLSRLSMKRR